METSDYQMKEKERPGNQRRLFWAYAASVLLIVSIIFAFGSYWVLDAIQQQQTSGGGILTGILRFFGFSIVVGAFTPVIGKVIMLAQLLGLVATGFCAYKYWYLSELNLEERHKRIDKREDDTWPIFVKFFLERLKGSDVPRLSPEPSETPPTTSSSPEPPNPPPASPPPNPPPSSSPPDPPAPPNPEI